MLIRAMACLLAATGAVTANDTLTLVGRIEPAGERIAPVWLRRVGTPFWTSKTAPEGKFAFKHLEPGAYVVTIEHPSGVEIQRTVQVEPGSADGDGEVELIIRAEPSEAAEREGLRRRHTVGVGELAVPSKAVQLWRKARRAGARGDLDLARQQLDRALALAPQFTEALLASGLMHFQDGNFAQAEPLFRRAALASAGNFEAAVNLGAALLQLSQYAESAQWSERALELSPDSTLASANLGLARYFLGQTDLAVVSLERAAELDPGHFSAPQLVLAKIYAERGQGVRATELLEELYRLQPGTAAGRAAWRILERTAPLRGQLATLTGE